MKSYEVEVQDGVPITPKRKKAKKHLSTRRILLYAFLAALICVLGIAAAIYAYGLRYIKIDTEIGGYVKFFGTVDAQGVPYKGKLYYSDGTTGEVDMLNHRVKFSNGDEYEGALNYALRMDGEGTMKYATGDIYTGTFKDGVISGEGTISYANGDEYKGTFVNGQKEGDGVYTWFDGSAYTGHFSANKKDGFGTYRWSDGSYYTGTYVADLKSGTGIFHYSNGDIYSGEFSNDARNGEGTYTWSNGDEYTGTFLNNEMNGHGIYRFASGRTFEGEFRNGSLVRDSGTDEPQTNSGSEG